ncbi:unnamed protein product [Symbiodinium sp. CCMP2456]|nr:unnamed protein product [Symbiodinium sp. CCMP2456]
MRAPRASQRVCCCRGERLQEVQAERLARINGQAGGFVAVGVQDLVSDAGCGHALVFGERVLGLALHEVRGHFVGQVLAACPGQPGLAQGLQGRGLPARGGVIGRAAQACAVTNPPAGMLARAQRGRCSAEWKFGCALCEQRRYAGGEGGEQRGGVGNGRNMSAGGLQCVNKCGIEPDGTGGMCLQEKVAAGSIGSTHEREAVSQALTCLQDERRCAGQRLARRSVQVASRLAKVPATGGVVRQPLLAKAWVSGLCWPPKSSQKGGLRRREKGRRRRRGERGAARERGQATVMTQRALRSRSWRCGRRLAQAVKAG